LYLSKKAGAKKRSKKPRSNVKAVQIKARFGENSYVLDNINLQGTAEKLIDKIIAQSGKDASTVDKENLVICYRERIIGPALKLDQFILDCDRNKTVELVLVEVEKEKSFSLQQWLEQKGYAEVYANTNVYLVSKNGNVCIQIKKDDVELFDPNNTDFADVKEMFSYAFLTADNGQASQPDYRNIGESESWKIQNVPAAKVLNPEVYSKWEKVPYGKTVEKFLTDNEANVQDAKELYFAVKEGAKTIGYVRIKGPGVLPNEPLKAEISVLAKEIADQSEISGFPVNKNNLEFRILGYPPKCNIRLDCLSDYGLSDFSNASGMDLGNWAKQCGVFDRLGRVSNVWFVATTPNGVELGGIQIKSGGKLIRGRGLDTSIDDLADELTDLIQLNGIEITQDQIDNLKFKLTDQQPGFTLRSKECCQRVNAADQAYLLEVPEPEVEVLCGDKDIQVQKEPQKGNYNGRIKIRYTVKNAKSPPQLKMFGNNACITDVINFSKTSHPDLNWSGITYVKATINEQPWILHPKTRLSSLVDLAPNEIIDLKIEIASMTADKFVESYKAEHSDEFQGYPNWAVFKVVKFDDNDDTNSVPILVNGNSPVVSVGGKTAVRAFAELRPKGQDSGPCFLIPIEKGMTVEQLSANFNDFISNAAMNDDRIKLRGTRTWRIDPQIDKNEELTTFLKPPAIIPGLPMDFGARNGNGEIEDKLGQLVEQLVPFPIERLFSDVLSREVRGEQIVYNGEKLKRRPELQIGEEYVDVFLKQGSSNNMFPLIIPPGDPNSSKERAKLKFSELTGLPLDYFDLEKATAMKVGFQFNRRSNVPGQYSKDIKGYVLTLNQEDNVELLFFEIEGTPFELKLFKGIDIDFVKGMLAVFFCTDRNDIQILNPGSKNIENNVKLESIECGRSADQRFKVKIGNYIALQIAKSSPDLRKKITISDEFKSERTDFIIPCGKFGQCQDNSVFSQILEFMRKYGWCTQNNNENPSIGDANFISNIHQRNEYPNYYSHTLLPFHEARKREKSQTDPELVPPDLFLKILEAGHAACLLDSPVVHLPQGPRYHVVGDIHGDIYALRFAVANFLEALLRGEDAILVCLGDYTDRGNRGINVVALLMLLKALLPHRVFLLRGNHEARMVTHQYGFLNECKGRYCMLGGMNKSSNLGEFIYNRIMCMFDDLSIMAVLGEKAVCTHGCLPVECDFSEMNEVAAKPGKDIPDAGHIANATWSDPNNNIQGIMGNARGAGHIIGLSGLEKLLKSMGSKHYDFVFRAHQVRHDGFASDLLDTVTQKAKCYTVFTQAHYCGSDVNKGSTVVFDSSTGEVRPVEVTDGMFIAKVDRKPPNTPLLIEYCPNFYK
jgi:predicted phosphodiesterase